jgi:hypothetical protein
MRWGNDDWDACPGTDVMITIFCDFCLFSAKNWRFSQKPMLWYFFLQNYILFESLKRWLLRQIFLRIKNHNICPWAAAWYLEYLQIGAWELWYRIIRLGYRVVVFENHRNLRSLKISMTKNLAIPSPCYACYIMEPKYQSATSEKKFPSCPKSLFSHHYFRRFGPMFSKINFMIRFF